VRAPAYLLWGAGAFFLHRLTRNLQGRDAARRSIVLYASLPVFFSVGILATPDAPMFACWTGALLCLERALLGRRPAAWLGAGAFLGLGMLSKYTIGLLVPAAALFCLLDRRSRSWFLRPQPYLALLLAAALFAPVIVWNESNHWASFAFQSTRRWSAGGHFGLHLLVGSLVVLLTPTGVLAAILAIGSRARAFGRDDDRPAEAARKRVFSLTFTLVPLLVFVVFSIRHAPKLIWGGPVWLALLPCMAARMTKPPGFLRRLWPATIGASLLLLGGGAYYISLGMPGAPPLRSMVVPAAWRELGERVAAIASEVQQETGEEPIRAGLDHYFLSSETSFYGPEGSAHLTAGRHLIGRDSLMWERWLPAEEVIGRDVVLLAPDAPAVSAPYLRKLFERLSEVRVTEIRRHGKPVAWLAWRIGYGYRGPPPWYRR
jgi:dolichol-phosphate mannosyltransferase